MSSENKYTFSFRRLREELITKKSFEPRKYDKWTELKWLCKTYLHDECIDDYSNIEWQALGITTNTLSLVKKWINNHHESARVLVYFRGHPNEVLSNAANNLSDEEISDFVKRCKKYLWIYNVLDLIIFKLLPPRLKNGEVYPFSFTIEHPEKNPIALTDTTKYKYIRAIQGRMDYGKFVMRDATVIPLLPITDNIRGNGSFTMQHILNVALNGRLYIRQQFYPLHTESDLLKVSHRLCTTNELEKHIRTILSLMTTRSLRGRTQPVIQALYAIFLYLSIESEEDSLYQPYYKAYLIALHEKLLKAGVAEQQLKTGLDALQNAIDNIDPKESEKGEDIMEFTIPENASPVIFVKELHAPPDAKINIEKVERLALGDIVGTKIEEHKQ